MIDYVQASELYNPYDHENTIVKWIATYYFADKERGNKKKPVCPKRLHGNYAELHKSDCIQANSYYNRHSTENDNTVPVWDVSFEKLQDAYKIVAMTRNLDWHTEQILEEKSCIPLFKIPKKVGDFPRRITWLYVDDGKLIDLDVICRLIRKMSVLAHVTNSLFFSFLFF